MTMGSGVLYFDLETANADQLHTYGPGFIRLAAWAWNDGPITVTDDIGKLLTQLEQARFIVGHNILGFDLPALERYHALDVESLVAANKVLDTLLAARQCDPPRAGGVDGGRYSLGSLGARLVGKSKLEDADDTLLKSLAEEYGGYDAIGQVHGSGVSAFR
ncbi:hypothetical protein [Corynebacterium pollutisoli]|nr:hypothetical protein [Corynebacterium pollutisoli]